MDSSAPVKAPYVSPYFDPFADDLPPVDSYASDINRGVGGYGDEPGGGRRFDPESEAAYQAREEERQREREALYARLNPRQAEAVNLPDVSALVLAGAGSGKTSVLTARVAKLATGSVAPRSILAVTFTNKASGEMKERLRKLLDKKSVNELWMGTFHSLCSKLLRENFEAAGLPKSFAILDTDGQEAICRGVLKDFGLTKASVKEAVKARAAAAASQDLLSAADPLAAAGALSADDVEDDGEANEFVTPSQCAKYISSRKEALKAPEPPASISVRSTDIDQMEAVFAEYQQRCAKSGLLDFQDLLTKGVDLLETNAEVREKYQSRFRAILVDEFQDTNDLQYRWLELMKGPNAFVMAVGDDSQCLAEGTLVTNGDGHQVPIERIKVGELVLANHGAGNFRPTKVTRAVRRPARKAERAITFRTASGSVISSTADHTHLAGFLPAYSGSLYVCYVMEKEGVGYRVGVTRMGTHSPTAREFTHGLSYRCSQEGADRAWVIATFKTEQRARIHEALTSLRYGIPTIPFYPRKTRLGTESTIVGDAVAIKEIFASADSAGGVQRLFVDIGLSLLAPHHVPKQSRFSKRKNITVTLCCWHRRSGTALHTVAFGFSDDATAKTLKSAGFSVRPAKIGSSSWRVEMGASTYARVEEIAQEIARLVPGAYIKRSMRLLDKSANGVDTKTSLDLLPAFNLQPGMVVCDADGKADLIVTVERHDASGDYFDIDVEGVHNFVANGVVTHNCIYGFRGANPENMGRFVREMAADKSAPDGRTIKLEQNYRSLPHILEAANAIIDRNPNQLKKTLFTAQPDRGEKIDLVTFSNGMFEASSIARSIHRMVKEQDVPPAEVAVLYRTNQQSRLIEQELNKLGIPLVVYGGYRFYDRQEIKVVMAYLDLVCDMTRDLSFARVANIPPRGIGERTIEELRQQAKLKGLSMMEMVGERSSQLAVNPNALGNAAAVKKQRQLEGFTDVILELAEKATELPLSKLIEHVLASAGLEAYYRTEGGNSKAGQAEAEERLKNIGELMSAARQFELENPELTTASDQLPEYLAYVALMTSTSESDMTRKNTVSLMTVHSSKGLEFDHVFLSGMEEQTFPHSRAIKEDEENGNGKSIDAALRVMGAELDDDGSMLVTDADSDHVDGEGMQEERRLMYVAVTRARKTLTLSHALERLNNGEVQTCEPSRFLEEIPAKRLRRIDDAKQGRKSGWGRSSGNREYGGDAYDTGRTEFEPLPEPTGKAAASARAELRTQTSFDAEDLASPTAANTGAGCIRVVSKRRGGTPEANDEIVIDVDRSHAVLGNRHFLNDHTDADERARVIDAYRADFERDMAAHGPMFRAVTEIADRVAGGERIALRCWCAPRDCHADIVRDKVLEIARAKLSEPADDVISRAGEAREAKKSGAAPAEGAARTVAIIGTAGRDKDRAMNRALWQAMLADAKRRVKPTDTLVSGGAAWADHLAVRLFLDGDVKQLVLHLPAPFDGGGFAGPERESAGSAANYYHGLFKRNAGVDSLAEIAQAIAKGAKVTEQPAARGYGAMYARNALVAKASDVIVAYTFGEGDVPADGGTKNTWDEAKSAQRVHVPLAGLTPSHTAAAEPAAAAAPPAPAQAGGTKPWQQRSWQCSATPMAAPPSGRPTQPTVPSDETRSRLAMMGRRPMMPRPR